MVSFDNRVAWVTGGGRGIGRAIALALARVEGTKISIRPESQARFTKRVKSVTQRNNPKPLEQIVVELNLFVRGWGNYFRIQERRSAFVTLDHWVRQRLRPCPTRPYSSNGVNRMGDNMHIS